MTNLKEKDSWSPPFLKLEEGEGWVSKFFEKIARGRGGGGGVDSDFSQKSVVLVK